MNLGIGTEAAEFLFLGIHKFDFRFSVGKISEERERKRRKTKREGLEVVIYAVLAAGGG
jgi:hypothetical protein